MKTLCFFLLGTLAAMAQTSFTNADIDAASGNRYETLLTNVELGYNDLTISAYLQKIGMTYSADKYHSYTDAADTQRFQKQIISGKEQQGYVYVKHYKKKIAQYKHPMTTKVEIWGDPQKVIEFFCGYWSTSLNFADVNPGEVVSCRFLTDVATLTFPDAKTAKITVVSAKDR